MARLLQPPTPSGHTILIVDDVLEVRSTLKELLEADGHQILLAENGLQALDQVSRHDVHLIILDYFMPGMEGEEVVRRVRLFNQQVQILLHTGYARDRPARQMMRELDIQGYHDKSHGPEQLLVLVDSALKAYRNLVSLNNSRDGMKMVIMAAPKVHKIQPVNELLTAILTLMRSHMGFQSAVLATGTGSWPGPVEEDGTPLNTALDVHSEAEDFAVRVGIGQYEHSRWSDLTDQEQAVVRRTAKLNRPQIDEQTAFPVSLNKRNWGVILFDRAFTRETDLDVVQMLATHTALALENIRLYNIAHTDALTGLTTRVPWEEQLQTELDRTDRYGIPTSILVIDLDKFKSVNDRYGHLTGDEVLRRIGSALLSLSRKLDRPCRYGGEEFMVLLPHTDAEEAMIVAERLLVQIAGLTIESAGHQIRVTASIGVATSRGEEGVRATAQGSPGQSLIHEADLAMYAAKGQGGNKVIGAQAALGQLSPVPGPASR